MVTRILIVALIGALLGAFPAQSEAGCCSLLSRMFPSFFGSAESALARDQALKLAETHQLDSLLGFQKASDQELLAYVDLLPLEVKKITLDAPVPWIQKESTGYLSNLSGLASRHPNCVVGALTVGDLLNKVKSRLPEISEGERETIGKEVRRKVMRGRLQYLLNHSGVPLNIENQQIHLGSRTYRILKVSAKEIILRARASDLVHPYENPVNIEHVVKLSQIGVKPPKKFDVAVGLDGKLYVEDGNHRLELLNAQDWVEVRISNPPTTVTLPAHFVLVGERFPGSDDFIQAIRDRKPIRSLVHEKSRSSVLFWDELERKFSYIDPQSF